MMEWGTLVVFTCSKDMEKSTSKKRKTRNRHFFIEKKTGDFCMCCAPFFWGGIDETHLQSVRMGILSRLLAATDERNHAPGCRTVHAKIQRKSFLWFSPRSNQQEKSGVTHSWWWYLMCKSSAFVLNIGCESAEQRLDACEATGVTMGSCISLKGWRHEDGLKIQRNGKNNHPCARLEVKHIAKHGQRFKQKW